ncbi:MAG: geranylgeranyl pyrophosphate synthase [Desulfitobacterium hafniense]|nr:geranylgeranyl pyrophosphate synthase [Desulfitobacterium hafniense]
MVPLELSFYKELHSVQNQLDKEISFKTAKFEELINLPMDELDENACAAIVLAVSKSIGIVDRKSIALAAIVQYIFMADRVHRLMKDTDLDEASRQFPVLVGDFLYGRFFLKLCHEGLHFFLAPLARTISTMNQGAVSRWLLKEEPSGTPEWIGVIEQESASLTGLAARLGAELGGASYSLQDTFHELGWELGLAWGAWRDNIEKHVVQNALSRAKEIIMRIPESVQIKPLYELYNYIVQRMGYNAYVIEV